MVANHLADGPFKLDIARLPDLTTVSFFGRRAEGPGYEGIIRRYDFQYSTNLGETVWFDIPGYTSLIGRNATVSYQTPGTNTPAIFFRGKAWLQSP